MEYTEKITWDGRSLVLKRAVKPTEVLSAQSGEVRIEKLDVNDPSVRPTNQDAPEGTPLRVYQADGVGSMSRSAAGRPWPSGIATWSTTS
jgi:hypothetical protein